MLATPEKFEGDTAPPSAASGEPTSSGLGARRIAFYRRIAKVPAGLLVAGVLTTGLLVTGALVLTELATAAHDSRERADARRASVQEIAAAAIKDRLAGFEEALRGAQGLIAAKKALDQNQWRNYVEAIRRSVDFRGVDAMCVVTRLTDGNRAQTLERLRKDGLPQFQNIPPHRTDSSLIPADEDWIHTHCEPSGVAAAVLGSDVRLLDDRQAAMELARDTDSIAFTPALHDLPGTGSSGIVMYMPVFPYSAARATLQERRDALSGWVGLRLRMDEFLGASVLKVVSKQAMIDLADGTPVGDEFPDSKLIYKGSSSTPGSAGDRASLTTLSVGGRTWTLRVSVPADSTPRPFPWALLLGGVGGSTAAAVLAWVVSIAGARSGVLPASVAAELRANAALARESEARLKFHRAAFDHATIVSETDALGRITYANDNFCAISGYTREELLGKDHRILNSAAHPKQLWKEMFATLVRDGIWQGVICNRAKSGRRYWVRSTMLASRDSEGKIARFMSIRTDVTAEIRAQREALEAEQFAQATVNALNAHVAILDEVGTIIAVNESWRQFGEHNGAGSDCVGVGVNYLDLCDHAVGADAEQAASVAQGIRDVIRGAEQSFAVQYPCHSRLEKRWFTVRVTRLAGEGAARVVVAHENITEVRLASERLEEHAKALQAQMEERRLAEAGLRESEERFRQFAENTQDVFWMSSADCTKILYISPRYEAVFGRSCRSLYENSMDWSDAIEPEDRPRVLEAWSKLPSTGFYEVEYRIRTAAGDTRWIRARAQPIRDTKGATYRYSGIAEDITVRRLTEEEMRIAMNAAEAANKAKSEFLATMSHEIRTPLNGVMGALELIDGSPLNEQQLRYLKIGRNAARSLLSVINDILDFSKIEAGKMELSPIDFDLYEVVEDVLDVLSVKAAEKGIAIDSTIDSSLPRMVHGDVDRIRQIVINLVNNAIKFTAHGGVAIKMGPVADAAVTGSNRVCISVSDTGVGIPEDRRNRLFKAFSQTDASTTRRYGGTGLGLAICKQLAELMGGSIDVESELGRGSTFWVELPLPRAEFLPSELRSNADRIANSALPVREESAVKPTPVMMRSSGLRPRILLAEDNEINQLIACEMLASAGYDCTVAKNGKEAVATVAAAPFDLVLMDCQMPEMDGFEATREIRRLELAGELPVQAGKRLTILALTANALKGDREHCLEAGMDGYTTKPIDLKLLMGAIEGSLSAVASAHS